MRSSGTKINIRANQDVFDTVSAAIGKHISTLVLAEAGTGMKEVAAKIERRFAVEKKVARVIYKGSRKQFYQELAEQLNIPIVNERNRPLTIEQLKKEIDSNIDVDTLFIFPEAHRLSIAIRYWLEEVLEKGVLIVCFAVKNPKKDIFLNLVDIEAELANDREIREIMIAEATARGITLDRSRISRLQPLAGRNPLLAKQVIARESISLADSSYPEHTQYLVVTPILVALALFGTFMRFVGVSTNDRSLYLLGGGAFIVFITIRQISRVKGSRKRLGE